MIPLALFLIACALVYLGTIEEAFGALVPLSVRLNAERSGQAETLGRYLDDPTLLFVPVRLLIGVVTVLAAAVLALLVGVGSVHQAVAVAAAAVLLLLACAHVVPLLIVRRSPDRVLEALLPSFAVCARVLRPLTAVCVRLGAGRRERSERLPADERDHSAAAPPAAGVGGDADGLTERDGRRLIRSIVEFGDTLVREVMTPRPDIVAIRAEATLGDLRALLREQTHSRIPVFNGSLDDVLGFVFVKDVVQLDAGEEKPLAALVRPAHFVPETKKVSALLKEFQREHVQSAIVVDEYGGTAGLVTMEDLIEEIVGEIRDEYDEESDPIVDEGKGVFVFTGTVDVDEVAERLGVGIAREGFGTVGGYVLSRLGRVPAVGERFEIDDLAVEVLEAERRRVHKVRIRKREAAERAGEPQP